MQRKDFQQLKKKVYIITEGGRRFGFGHIVRCKALYDAFKQQNAEIQMIIEGDETLLPILDTANHRFVAWHNNNTNLLALCKNSDICILDSYHAPAELYHKIAQETKILASFDDTNRIEYPPNSVLINGILHANRIFYANQTNVNLLLGLEYQCVRTEFWNQAAKKINNNIQSILITVGGNDIRNIIPVLVETTKLIIPDAQIDIVVGASSQNIELLKNLRNPSVTLHINADAKHILSLMTKADLAISAAGQTLCELACCGVPGISVSVIDNQLAHAKAWSEEGCFTFAGEWNDSNFQRNLSLQIQGLNNPLARQNQSTKMQQLIDGNGAQRIMEDIIIKL